MRRLRSVSTVGVTILYIVCRGLPAIAAEDTRIPWTDRQVGAKQRAKAEAKPIFVDVWAVWCGPCKRMDETTFVNAAVISEVENFVPLKVDVDAQPLFVEHHRINAYPTYLLLDAAGTELTRLTGYVAADRLVNLLKSVRHGYADYIGATSRSEDLAAMQSIAAYLQGLGGYSRAVDLLRKAVRLGASLPVADRQTIEVELASAQIGAGQNRAALKSLKRLAASAENPAARERARDLLTRAEASP